MENKLPRRKVDNNVSLSTDYFYIRDNYPNYYSNNPSDLEGD